MAINCGTSLVAYPSIAVMLFCANNLDRILDRNSILFITCFASFRVFLLLQREN